jgi:hypothetical protein
LTQSMLLVLLSALYTTALILLVARCAGVLVLATRGRTATVLEGASRPDGYSHSTLRSRQVPQVGRVSSHFTLRFLQLLQPSRDF